MCATNNHEETFNYKKEKKNNNVAIQNTKTSNILEQSCPCLPTNFPFISPHRLI